MTGLEFLEKQDAVEAYIGNSFFNAFAGGLTSKGGGVGVGGGWGRALLLHASFWLQVTGVYYKL